MNFGFELALIARGKLTTVYALHIEGEEQSEYHKFRDNPELRVCPDHREIVKRLGEILKYGCKEMFFKKEIRPLSKTDTIRALHYENESLRLYCCRWSFNILILGNGGIKTVRAFQEDPYLNDCVAKLEYVDARLRERIQSKDDDRIFVDGRELVGRLTFDALEDYE